MTTIEMRFPAHRFHATPWGRHVNEGAAEWPPSPYRLLRALYDAWKRKHVEIAAEDVEATLTALASEAPRFDLPPAVASHTRSYLNSNTEDPTAKSLIFDGFVAVEPGAACYVSWPGLDLTERQRETLDRLLTSLNYVGRSESWVEARLHEGEFEGGVRCEPIGTGGSGDAIPVACAVPAADYREKVPWMAALASSTTDFQKERRSAPPAMRMVSYGRPAGALVTRVSRPAKGHHAGTQAVLLGLDAKVLPLATATVEIAEQIRVRLMGIHKRLTGDPILVSQKFSGKDASGAPLREHHHVFILPQSRDGFRIDRVLIYTRDKRGFDGDELRSILQVDKLYGSTDEAIRVVATWRGGATDVQVRPGTRKVVSVTPFSPARYWRKGRGTFAEFLAEEVRRECRNHGLPEPASVSLLEKPSGVFEWIEFRRNRKGETPRPGYGFRVEFDEPVSAPFSLGYGCHYGLGQFDSVG